MNLKSTYNRIAEDWFKDHKDDDLWWIEGGDKFISLLKNKGLVLDLGCGAGFKTKYLTSKGLEVIGIDFSEKMIGLAKQVVPNGKFIIRDVKNLNSLEYIFDGIFAQAILLHFSKREIRNILNNWINKLKRGGYLYITTKEIKKGQKEEMIVEESDYGYKYKRFFSYFTLEEIENYFVNLNMKICWKKRLLWNNSQWIQIIGQKQ